jgi:hypothetical protein
MARSSQAAMGFDNGATDDVYETKIQNLRSDLKRYKDRCKLMTREREMLKNNVAATNGCDVLSTRENVDPRKQSDAGSSDTSARVQRFHRLAQTMKTMEGDKSSKVTRQGKKLIIEQTPQSAGNSFELTKILRNKKK